MMEHDDFIIQQLLEDGLLDAAQLAAARKAAASDRTSVCEALCKAGVLTERTVAVVHAQICEVPFVDLAHYRIDIRNAEKLSKSIAESLQALPLFILENVITVGMANPMDLRAVDQLRSLLKCDVDPVLCEPKPLSQLISRVYAMSTEGQAPATTDPTSIDMTTGREPIVAAVNQIISQAVEKRASDIHLGPDETTLHLRYRIDGELITQQGPALSAHLGLVQRLKVMANLDLTQSRRPQDGKFRFNHNGRAVDIRLSIIPTVCGENVVMRLLTSGAAIRGFGELGFSPGMTKQIEETLSAPYGMLLTTGPTGSGKTTTLYTALKHINTPDVNIITIEDPVEIRLPLIRQVQVNAEIGMTFGGALRSILRQDPDVVMVGEIRDEETARICVQAALTGHLVLSTLHTNDAAGAIPRLRDFGCPPFAINAALLGVIAQRLARRTCPDCAKPQHPGDMLLKHFGLTPDDGAFTAGSGCARCGSTGFVGRVGLYELLNLSPAVQNCIEQNAPLPAIRKAALKSGFAPMWQDGLAKARTGQTTLAEVARLVAIAESTKDTLEADVDDVTITRLSA